MNKRLYRTNPYYKMGFDDGFDLRESSPIGVIIERRVLRDMLGKTESVKLMALDDIQHFESEYYQKAIKRLKGEISRLSALIDERKPKDPLNDDPLKL